MPPQQPVVLQSLPPVAPAAAPAGQVAYDKEGLKILLAAQASPTRPGLVRVVASFQTTGTNVVTGMNFQAAVPKVRFFASYLRVS